MTKAELQAITKAAHTAWGDYWQQLERVYGKRHANTRHYEASSPGAAVHGLQHTDPALIAAYEEQQTAKVRAFYATELWREQQRQAR